MARTCTAICSTCSPSPAIPPPSVGPVPTTVLRAPSPSTSQTTASLAPTIPSTSPSTLAQQRVQARSCAAATSRSTSRSDNRGLPPGQAPRLAVVCTFAELLFSHALSTSDHGGVFLRLASLCERRAPKPVPTCLPTDGVLGRGAGAALQSTDYLG